MLRSRITDLSWVEFRDTTHSVSERVALCWERGHKRSISQSRAVKGELRLSEFLKLSPKLHDISRIENQACKYSRNESVETDELVLIERKGGNTSGMWPRVFSAIYLYLLYFCKHTFARVCFIQVKVAISLKNTPRSCYPSTLSNTSNASICKSQTILCSHVSRKTQDL